MDYVSFLKYACVKANSLAYPLNLALMWRHKTSAPSMYSDAEPSTTFGKFRWKAGKHRRQTEGRSTHRCVHLIFSVFGNLCIKRHWNNRQNAICWPGDIEPNFMNYIFFRWQRIDICIASINYFCLKWVINRLVLTYGWLFTSKVDRLFMSIICHYLVNYVSI